MNKLLWCMHEPFLQQGTPEQKKTASGLEENSQTRGTDFKRINLKVKHGELEHSLMVSTIYLTKSIVLGKAKEQ
ncbi:hypothetical protein QLH62_02050 [Streptococcus iniae]|nr:hypothetical protein QLH62_02050 [Streptococcus iniae]